MNRRLQIVVDYLGVYGLWLLLAVFAALTAFEVYAASIYLGILVVENPVLRPVGWSTTTITSLSRMVVLILGILWLGLIIFSEEFLREGQEQQVLISRVKRLFGLTAGIYLLIFLVFKLF